jgi:hypothetical protein
MALTATRIRGISAQSYYTTTLGAFVTIDRRSTTSIPDQLIEQMNENTKTIVSAIVSGGKSADVRTWEHISGTKKGFSDQAPDLNFDAGDSDESKENPEVVFKVKFTENRVRRTIELDLTEAERSKIEESVYQLPEVKSKKRRFPLGNSLLRESAALLAAIRPHESDSTLDKLFSGQYQVISELLTSFTSDALQLKACRLVRAQMSRLKGEGLFFNTEALIGQGAELAEFGSFDDL